MSDTEFDIIFRGDIVLGHQLSDVKARLQQLFKADAGRIDQLFSGRPVPIRRQLDRETADKYKAALLKAGAQVEVRPSVADKNASVERKLTLAPAGALLLRPSEREKVMPLLVDTAGLSLRPQEGPLLDVSEQPEPPELLMDIPDFELAPAGENLLRDSERQELPVAKVGDIDWVLAEAGSDLGQLKPQLPPLSPDISHLQLKDN